MWWKRMPSTGRHGILAQSVLAPIGLLLWASAVVAQSASTAPPTPDADVTITGKPETVFDHAAQACEDIDIPDAPAHAFRDAEGNIQLLAAHYTTYRMIGKDFAHLKKDCSAPVMRSDYDPDPAKFEDNEWPASPYTLDGNTIYVIVHEENHPWQHTTPPFDSATTCGLTGLAAQKACWYNALTYAVSTDGGKTYSHTAPPSQVVAEMPYRYQPRMGKTGIFAPSNIVRNKADGFFYVFAYAMADNSPATRHLCVLRTQNLADPKSWRGWDGSGFGVVFKDPYQDNISDPQQATCAPVQGLSNVRSVTYNTYLKKWLAVGDDSRSVNGSPVPGFYDSTSNDLIHWSRPKLIMETPTTGSISMAYPSLIDHNDTSANFENSGRQAYLYYATWPRTSNLARNLVRVPVIVAPPD